MNLWSIYKNCDVLRRHSTKWSHYFGVYEKHFERFRNRPSTIWEIGIGHGGSLQLWQRYFGPEARIVGIDIDERCKFVEQSIQTFIGDVKDKAFLKRVLECTSRPDILIDDGSHAFEDQKAAFEALYPEVARDGIYIIEDLAHVDTRFLEYCRKFLLELNAYHTTSESATLPGFTYDTRSIHFYDSMVVFEKGQHDNPYPVEAGYYEMGEFTNG